MRNSLILIPMLALIAACASGPPLTAEGKAQEIPEVASRRPVVLAIPELRTIYGDQPKAIEDLVRADAATVRFAIKKMFAELDIPLTVDEPKLHTFGNNDFQKIYRMGNRPMSDFVDCGSSALGQRTATYRIYLSMLTVVDSLRPNSTLVKSTVTAQARDVSAGATRPGVPCGTTGKLEQMLINSVVALSER